MAGRVIVTVALIRWILLVIIKEMVANLVGAAPFAMIIAAALIHIEERSNWMRQLLQSMDTVMPRSKREDLPDITRSKWKTFRQEVCNMDVKNSYILSLALVVSLRWKIKAQ